MCNPRGKRFRRAERAARLGKGGREGGTYEGWTTCKLTAHSLLTFLPSRRRDLLFPGSFRLPESLPRKLKVC